MSDKMNPGGGSRFSPRPIKMQSNTVYAAGTAYQLTAVAALLNLATTPASLTLTDPGTYLLMASARLDYNAATFAAVRTATLKLRRTNNTPADLTNGSTSVKTQVVTTITFTLFDGALPFIIYTTQNNNDIIQIFGNLDVVPTAGSLDAVEADIVAIKLS